MPKSQKQLLKDQIEILETRLAAIHQACNTLMSRQRYCYVQSAVKETMRFIFAESQPDPIVEDAHEDARSN